MTKKPARTRPLDRDGDGQDGGSLPGNQTAPMAGDAAQPEWVRDNDVITLKLEEAGVRDADEQPIDLANVTQWPDEDAQAAEVFADAMMATGKHTDHNGTERNADGTAIELPEILRERTVIAGAGAASQPDWVSKLEAGATFLRHDDGRAGTYVETEADGRLRAQSLKGGGFWTFAVEDCCVIEQPEATFTPEEIAAGQTPVVEQEGEATATAADQATQLDETDPLATVETDKAPIAVRLSDLQVLTSARRLYHTREGYSATWNAPFLDEATVDGWVAAGLAEAIPSAGNTGGVRATDEARKLERQLRSDQAEAA